MEQRTPDETLPAVVVGGLVAVVAVALLTAGTPSSALPATLLIVGDTRGRSGFVTMVGWIVGGALAAGALGYAAVGVVALPLSPPGAAGLGLALGGGLGALSNLLVADAGGTDEPEPESVTVEMDGAESPSPRPADLFEGHPDPVLYVTDEGAGPVVLAANRAYAETFDIPADTITGTPLDEVAMLADDSVDVTAAVVGRDSLDGIYDCRTPDGERSFRLRSVGSDTDGYLIYTPTGAGA